MEDIPEIMPDGALKQFALDVLVELNKLCETEENRLEALNRFAWNVYEAQRKRLVEKPEGFR